MLIDFGQNGKRLRCYRLPWEHVVIKPSANRQALSHSLSFRWNVVSPYISWKGRLTARKTEEYADMGGQKKRKVICNELHKDWNIILSEREQTSDWSFIARELVELLKKGKQMSVKITCAPGNHRNNWHDINWKCAHRKVRKLQVRIAKATKEGRYNKVKSLQWILTHS